MTYATIDLVAEDYDRFYVGFANSSLWPLLHFRLGLMGSAREDLDGYLAVNEIFAAALLPLLRPDDLVWVHDYHLIPLATALRASGVADRIGFFLHIPFVPPSVLEALPPAREICCSDSAPTMSSASRRGPIWRTSSTASPLHRLRRSRAHRRVTNGRRVRDPSPTRSASMPIGFSRSRRDPSARPTSARCTTAWPGGTLAIGADRLDYSKGLPNRFDSFQRLLKRFPEHKQRGQLPADRRALARGCGGVCQPCVRSSTGWRATSTAATVPFDWVPLRYMTQSRGALHARRLFRIARSVWSRRCVTG